MNPDHRSATSPRTAGAAESVTRGGGGGGGAQVLSVVAVSGVVDGEGSTIALPAGDASRARQMSACLLNASARLFWFAKKVEAGESIQTKFILALLGLVWEGRRA